jgi:hypothetical protein
MILRNLDTPIINLNKELKLKLIQISYRLTYNKCQIGLLAETFYDYLFIYLLSKSLPKPRKCPICECFNFPISQPLLPKQTIHEPKSALRNIPFLQTTQKRFFEFKVAIHRN